MPVINNWLSHSRKSMSRRYHLAVTPSWPITMRGLNGKFDLRFGMFPTEGYGHSNNPKVMGPPKFADSAFDVAAPKLRLI
ncbi:MAG: DUF2141 domain-containing protein [Azonexus sp.]